MAMPINTNGAAVRDVREWLAYGRRHYGVRTWKSAMDRFATEHGVAVAMLPNDGARFVERNGTRLVRSELSPESVAWHSGDIPRGLAQ